MNDLFYALALIMIIEGLLYAAFPEQMKGAIRQILQAPNSEVRIFALIIAAIGLLVLYMLKGFGSA